MTLKPPKLVAWNLRGFNNPTKVSICKNLVQNHDIDLLFILEAKTNTNNLSNHWFQYQHRIFPFENSCDNFQHSNPGRIWVKWNAGSINFVPQSTTSQLVHGIIQIDAISTVAITAVYASNSHSERLSLWSDLQVISQSICTPWAIIGDFNCCRFTNEKAGGLPLSSSNLGDFNNMIFNTGMHDLASIGHFYTWFNQQSNNPIHIKLDRMLVNDLWLSTFPNSYYFVGEPSCSDHSPLLLMNAMNSKRGHRFLFKNYCIRIPEFWDCLLDTFSQTAHSSPLADFAFKLKSLKLKIKQRNWSNSNNIQKDIDLLTEQQANVLGLIQSNPLNDFLNNSLKSINTKLYFYQTTLSDWIVQRGKVNWLTQGEDDLKFLYSKINANRNYSNIKEITTDMGRFTDHHNISLAFINHFSKLFNPPNCIASSHSFPVGKVVPNHLISTLIAPVSEEEIKGIIFSGKKNAAPGPDGFTFEFYRACWDTIKHHICKAVSHFFTSCYMPKQIKNTAIALIPKLPHANCVKDFRPISLCNVIYKVIAKILANRMKNVMPSIIHHSQSGFIQKRMISDNIILATEILGKFNNNSRNKYFCAKFDITKAFDSVSREFIYKRLADKGFPDLFVSWIKACTDEVSFSVCINGSLEGYFQSRSGLRQGCPLSPYLFSIVMDALSNSMDEAISKSTYTAIASGNCVVSHLLFADDLLIFGNANLENAVTLNRIFKIFGDNTGLFVNPLKSTILISKDTPQAEAICNELQIIQSQCSVTYLGIPIFHKKQKISDFQPLIQKISSKLNGWTAKTLSFAGRVQLIKFTICNTLAYWIRGAIIPKGCCKVINRLCSRFLYFGNTDLKKLHILSWKDTCVPTLNGGLGIQSIDTLYHSFGCTLIWRFLTSESLLFSWWKACYHSLWKPLTGKTSSYWKFLYDKAQNIKHCIKMNVGFKSNLSLIWDPWLNGNSIANYFNCLELYRLSPYSSWAVKNIIMDDCWIVPECFGEDISSKIHDVEIMQDEDDLAWLNTSKPTASTFKLQFYSMSPVVPWHKFIWHKNNCLRYSAFAWLAFRNGLKTAQVLQSRGISVNNSCCFCHEGLDSTGHLFFECNFTFNIISQLLPWLKNRLMKPNLFQTFDSVLDQGFGNININYHLLSACAVIYYIWRARNDRIFGRKFDCSTTVTAKIRYAIAKKTLNWKG
ncbi:Putative ribonuclease H protein [Dendrobium catenatum]|uniref:Ribonuclease H protein n=1 Tax=Dendrobium catenatum TaxID=906689 RepID=A0A2I0W7X9_9ASPA|nr:Putative ribonuclease H protein [Dendrobium catenatum]